MVKWWLAVAIALLAVWAGIAASAQGRENPVATYSGGAPAFMAAPSGTLVLQDGCLYLDFNASGSRRLLVFHDEEVAWAHEPGELTYRGTTYRPGDHIELMGGTMNLRHLEGLRLPESCVPGNDPIVVAPSG